MSELRDRFERLAGRGSPRGADEVLHAAMRGVPANEVNGVPDDNVSDLPIIDDDAAPMVTAEAEPRSRARTLVAVFGVAALVGVSGLAVASIFGNGGAASPEGAVRQLADAISHKDPLAAVDVLSPTEVRSMRQSVEQPHAPRRRPEDRRRRERAARRRRSLGRSPGALDPAARRRLHQGDRDRRRALGELALGADVEAPAGRPAQLRLEGLAGEGASSRSWPPTPTCRRSS